MAQQNTWEQVWAAADAAVEVVDGHFEEFDYDKVVKLNEELKLPEGIRISLDGGYDSPEGEYVEPVVIASGWMDHYVDGVYSNVIRTSIPVK